MSNHQGGPNITTRKKRRGMIEKRRRDKINNSLSELRRLVPAAFEKQGSAKLEKAEILQMTVDYLRSLHAKGIADNLKHEPGQQMSGLALSVTGDDESNNQSTISSQHQDVALSHHQNLNNLSNLHLHHHQQTLEQHQQQQQQQQQEQQLQYNQGLCTATPAISSPSLHAAAHHHHLYNQHHMSVAAAAAAEHASAAAAAEHATAAYRHLSNPLMTSSSDMAGMISHHAASTPNPHLNLNHHHHHQSPLVIEHSHSSLLNLDHHHHQHHAYHNPLSAHYSSTKTY